MVVTAHPSVGHAAFCATVTVAGRAIVITAVRKTGQGRETAETRPLVIVEYASNLGEKADATGGVRAHRLQ
jgi:hypothetical protein